jgi:hypothetical protein
MTQTSTPRIVRIAVTDLRHGDVVVNEAGERLYAAFDLEMGTQVVYVWPADSDVEAGRAPRRLELPRRVDGKPATLLLRLEAPTAGARDLMDLVDATLQQDQPAPVQGTPTAVVAALPHAIHVIDAHAVAPGIVELIVSPGQDRAAVAALLQAGYVAVRRMDGQTVVAHQIGRASC